MFFAKGTRLAAAAEAAKSDGDWDAAQALHGEACDAFEQSLKQEARTRAEREQVRVLITYHSARRRRRTSTADSLPPPPPPPPPSLYSPMVQRGAAPTPSKTIKPPARALLSVSVATDELQRFEEEFAAFKNTMPPELPAMAAAASSSSSATKKKDDDDGGFYEISKRDLLHPSSSSVLPPQPPPPALSEREIQQVKSRIHQYMTAEREALRRKQEELWTLEGVVRIASQELERAYNKQAQDIKLLEDRLMMMMATRRS